MLLYVRDVLYAQDHSRCSLSNLFAVEIIHSYHKKLGKYQLVKQKFYYSVINTSDFETFLSTEDEMYTFMPTGNENTHGHKCAQILQIQLRI